MNKTLLSCLSALLVGASAWAVDYELVTDAATLQAGDNVIIAAAGSPVAMSTNQKPNNRGEAAITVANGVITDPSDDVQIFTLELEDDLWAFYTGSGYIYAASSSKNYLNTQTTLDDNGKATIEIKDGIATIKFQGKNTHNWLRYNSSSSLFSCYTSGQADVALYREVGAGSEDKVPAPFIGVTGKNMVEISCRDEEAAIYYTTDGTEPTTTSTLYEAPFAITETTEVKAIACKGDLVSAVTTQTCYLNTYYNLAAFIADAPSTAVTFDFDATVTFQSADLRYTFITDGASNLQIFVSSGMTAYEQGDVIPAGFQGTAGYHGKVLQLQPVVATFAEATEHVTVEPTLLTLAQVKDENAKYQSAYIKLENVDIVAANSGKSHTIKQGDVTATLYNQFGVEVASAEGVTVYAICGSYDGTPQVQLISFAGGNVVETVATPTFSEASGKLEAGTVVTIECATEGATILYSLDEGQTWNTYTQGLTINEPTTIIAYATKEGCKDSAKATATYRIAVVPTEEEYEVTFNFAEPSTLSPAYSDEAGETADSNGATYDVISGVTFEEAGVEFTATKGTTDARLWHTAANAIDLRVYKTATITITAPENYTIEAVTLAGTTKDWSATVGTVEAPEWTADGADVNALTISVTGTLRIRGVDVTVKKVNVGVSDVVANTEAALYYNLQGVAVEASNLTPGLYIKRQGAAATKVLVR